MVKHRDGVPLTGSSPAIIDLRSQIEYLGASDAKLLITGESGVGKEVVARAIHARGPRGNRPFVPINCAGIPETLLESELFGHVKGSFTGAFRDKQGRLEMADSGTMFLDEVGEMSLRMQGLLLRFLETGEIQKVGAERVTFVTNVRLIAATNRNLRDQIARGEFREDLYYRLKVIEVAVPPLRERRSDIPALIEYFLNCRLQAALARGDGATIQPLKISDEANAALLAYSWPGNVRELENVIERLVVLGRGRLVEVGDLANEIRTPSVTAPKPRLERRRTVADELFAKLTQGGTPFWTSVYPMYMNREVTRKDMRELIHKGLEEARGNYRIVLRMFNMESKDYKRFLNFLRKHDCRLNYKEYRRAG